MKIISPFEFAILQACDPEEAKNCRAETSEEKEVRLRDKAIEFANRIKIDRKILHSMATTPMSDRIKKQLLKLKK
jgi:hypothetical protein